MGNVLAKLPQQRMRAGDKHPTTVKLEKLFDYMDELHLELAFYYDRVFVIDQDRPQDKDWEIRDVVNNQFLTEIPCYVGEYKITQDVDVSPREAQPAPKNPKKVVPKKSFPKKAKGLINRVFQTKK
jgi:hypothetical protein